LQLSKTSCPVALLNASNVQMFSRLLGRMSGLLKATVISMGMSAGMVSSFASSSMRPTLMRLST